MFLMLDKSSKKVLDYVSDIYHRNGSAINSANHGKISFLDEDIQNLGLDPHKLYLICEHLKNRGYFNDAAFTHDNEVTVWISHVGLTYYEYEKQKLFYYWFPIVIQSLLSFCALILSMIAIIIN